MPAYDELAALEGRFGARATDAMKRHRFWTPAASRFSASQYRCPRIDLQQNNAHMGSGTGKRFTLRHPMPVFSLSMSEDGRFAYTGALDGNLYEWDAKTGETLRTIPLSSG